MHGFNLVFFSGHNEHRQVLLYASLSQVYHRLKYVLSRRADSWRMSSRSGLQHHPPNRSDRVTGRDRAHLVNDNIVPTRHNSHATLRGYFRRWFYADFKKHFHHLKTLPIPVISQCVVVPSIMWKQKVENIKKNVQIVCLCAVWIGILIEWLLVLSFINQLFIWIPRRYTDSNIIHGSSIIQPENADSKNKIQWHPTPGI